MNATGRGHANDIAPPITRSTECLGDLERELVSLRPGLRARALFLTQGSAAADNLVQDVVERALLARHRFQLGTSLKAWLHSIMRNLHIDGCRQRRSRGLNDLQLQAAVPETHEGPLDLLGLEDVHDAIKQLRPAHREIFELAHIRHLSYREISLRLGVPTNTAGTRLRRARSKLRELLTRVYETRRRAATHGPRSS